MNAWGIAALVMAASAMVTALILSLVTTDSWRVGRRLRMVSQDEANARQEMEDPEQGRIPVVSTMLERVNRYGTLERRLKQAGLNWRPEEFTVACVAAALVLSAVGWLLSPLAALAGILLALVGAWLMLDILQKSRLRQFENQLPDALMLVASSLRSGYGLQRAIQAIRDEMRPPISVEFAKVLDETNVGLGMPEALHNLLQRVPLPDLDIAVTAILIQLDVGGNLAEVIEIVANTVRERQRISAEVDTLTAEGKLSGVILFILPIVMAVVITMLNPTYMAALFKTSIGHLLLFCGACLEIIGGFVIKRMLEIDF
ncbi:MAG: type II secretion system F family protein [Armatimonadota bacterium]